MARRLLVVAVSIGCGGATNPSSDHMFGARVMIDSTATVAHEYYSGFGDAAQFVIADGITWATVWARLYGGLTTKPPLPAVDFSTERVVLAALGGRPTGGYDIRIDSIVRFDRGSVAFVTATAPGPSCVGTLAFTQPAHLVRLSLPHDVFATPNPIAFEQRAVVRDCS